MTRRPKRLTGEGFHLRIINGETVRLRRFEVLRVQMHRYMVGFYLLLWIGLVLVDPSGQTTTPPIAARVVQYGFGVLTVIATFTLVYASAEVLFGGKGQVVTMVNWPLVLGASVLGLGVSELVVHLLTGEVRTTAKIFATLGIFYYVIIEIALQIIIWLFLPRILTELRDDAPDTTPDATPANVVRAGGHDFPATAILHIAAQGNYVTVTTDTTRTEVPGPFSALVDQIPEGLGLRIHRSHWVARRAVVAHRRKGRDMALDLTTGIDAPVALPRHTAVLDWLERTDPRANADQPTPASDATPPQAPPSAFPAGTLRHW